jgi:hypothetical protein
MFCYVKLGSGFLIMLFSLCCLQQMGNCGPGSSVSIVSGQLGDRGSIPSIGKRIFPLASVSRPALGPTQPPVQWVPGVLSPGLKHGRGVTLTIHPHLCQGRE